MALRFGVQTSSPQGNPEISAETAQAVEELIQIGKQNGHITPANEEAERARLEDIARRADAGDPNARVQWTNTVDTFKARPRFSGGFLQDIGDIFSGGIGNREMPGPAAENALGIPGARTETLGGKTYIIGPDGKILDEITGTTETGGAMTPTQRDYDAALARGDITAEEYREAQRRRILGTTSTGGYASTDLKDLEEAAKRAEAIGDTELAAQYRARAQAILLGDSNAAMSPGESARLAEDIRQFDLEFGLNQQEFGLSQQRFGLEQERFGQEKLQNQIQAAKTAQPLTYLSLLRGSPQQYAGLGQFAPTLAEGGGAAPAGNEPIPMPPSMQALQAGEPIKQAGFPQTVLRFEGPQAQRNLTPFELSANAEAREFQGVPLMDQEYQQALLRRGVGTGLRFGGYGGTIR